VVAMPWLLTAAAAVSTSSTLVPATKREDIRPPRVESSAKWRSDEFRESAIRTERNMGMETAWRTEKTLSSFF
jgi:hypothetical protein